MLDINSNIKVLDGYFSIKTSLAKRCLDLIGAGIGILLALPVLIVFSLFIKLVSPGPVLFTQARIGRGGRIFNCYKFRTMHPNVDTKEHEEYLCRLINGNSGCSSSETPMTKIENASKIIPFGCLLRASGLDELPQLFNVIKGDMSLVGPRPAIPYEVREYKLWHKQRLDVLPGITGLWQVSGKNKLSFKEMIRLDLQYSQQQSFWMDIIILVKTPQVVLLQAYEEIVNKFRQRIMRRSTI